MTGLRRFLIFAQIRQTGGEFPNFGNLTLSTWTTWNLVTKCRQHNARLIPGSSPPKMVNS